jgi:NAD(P)-dependent dehydrogenase (short-subunit alcohol dehydrogenase family)
MSYTPNSIIQTDINLRNTTALVIGGSAGIGRGIADALAAAHARVVVLSRTSPRYSPTVPMPLLEWRALDLSDPSSSRMQLSAVLEEFGTHLDAVFYSAIHYGAKRTPFLAVSEDEWLRQVNVNLNGLWLSLALTLPALQQRAPSLFVHLSSEVVYNAGPERSGYAATKAAASNLMRSIAQEDHAAPVRLVQLLPEKMVDTAGIRSRRPDDFDYSDYMTPRDFQLAALQLMQTRGEGKHGESFVVGENGEMRHINDLTPASQSRRG